MDRFIAFAYSYKISDFFNLKSNMDRFIARNANQRKSKIKNLKSNMDRFIGSIWFID